MAAESKVPIPGPGRAAAETLRAGGAADFLPFLWVMGQVALLTWVVDVYEIEQAAFSHVMQLTLAGFVVHHLLPQALKLPFFVLVSVLALGLVLGAVNAAWVVAVGLALIGACHLPISFGKRVAVVVALGVAMVAFQAGWVSSGKISVIWPILGSMFCFRLVVYLYDMRTQGGAFGFWRSLAYFFMSPNVCFLLFPVVDYKTFCKTYYNDEPVRVYQSGATWISRGLVQLVLYRFVYQFLVMDPSEVASAGDLFRYMVTTLLLYLKVSGTFHVIVGMLHLFGFNLPETHHRWLLASSFVDYWQRINIYWKEFMAKLVFYPMNFRLGQRQGISEKGALVLSVGISFFFTWLLHSYQWFWIRGTYLLAAPDMAFWGILGLLLAVNMLWQQKFVRKRSLKKGGGWSWKSDLSLGLRTVLTFVAICVLWSLWGAESIGDWLAMWAQAGRVEPGDVGLIGGVLLTVGLAGAMLGRSQREWTYQGAAGKGAAKAAAAGLNWRQLGWAGAGVLASCAVLITPVKTRLVYHASPQVASVMKSLRTSRLNVRDAAILEHGYYEDLTHAERFNPQLFELYSKMPAGMDVRIKGEGIRPTHDFRRRELVPAQSAVFSNGIELKVNAHGLRDREYDLHKPAGTLRIAVVGASEVMGWGVENHETFENLLEDWLNTHNTTDRYGRYEVMNFSVSGYGAIEKLLVLEQRVLDFDPDVLFYMANKKEYQLVIDRIVEAVRGGVDLPYDFLETITAEEGIDRDTHEVLAKGRLRPRAPEMLGLVYNRVASLCRDHGIQPVWVYVPQPGAEPPNRRDINKFFEHAEEAGFDILDLSDAFAGAPTDDLRMAEWDSHPNVAGHQALAECLKRKLQEHPRLSHLLLGDGASIDQVGQAFKEPSRVQTKE